MQGQDPPDIHHHHLVPPISPHRGWFFRIIDNFFQSPTRGAANNSIILQIGMFVCLQLST